MIDTYSPYSKYQGRSLGRVLHFLYHYCGLSVAENAIFGKRRDMDAVAGHSDNSFAIHYFGEQIATGRWEGNTPVFVFVVTERSRQAFWTQQQDRLRETIERAPDAVAYIEQRLADFKKALEALPQASELNKHLFTRWVDVVNGLPTDLVKDFERASKLFSEITK